MVSCTATGLMPRAPTLKRGSMKSAGQEAKLSYLGQEELAKRKRSLTEPQRLRQFDKRSFGCHSC
jgi:hypothetical protein